MIGREAGADVCITNNKNTKDLDYCRKVEYPLEVTRMAFNYLN